MTRIVSKSQMVTFGTTVYLLQCFAFWNMCGSKGKNDVLHIQGVPNCSIYA
jgi:hypothetical protein